MCTYKVRISLIYRIIEATVVLLCKLTPWEDEHPHLIISIIIINHTMRSAKAVICYLGYSKHLRMFFMRHRSFTATSTHGSLSFFLLTLLVLCPVVMWYWTTQAFNAHLLSHRRLSYGRKKLNACAQNARLISLTPKLLLITVHEVKKKKHLCLWRS